MPTADSSPKTVFVVRDRIHIVVDGKEAVPSKLGDVVTIAPKITVDLPAGKSLHPKAPLGETKSDICSTNSCIGNEECSLKATHSKVGK